MHAEIWFKCRKCGDVGKIYLVRVAEGVRFLINPHEHSVKAMPQRSVTVLFEMERASHPFIGTVFGRIRGRSLSETLGLGAVEGDRHVMLPLGPRGMLFKVGGPLSIEDSDAILEMLEACGEDLFEAFPRLMLLKIVSGLSWRDVFLPFRVLS